MIYPPIPITIIISLLVIAPLVEFVTGMLVFCCGCPVGSANVVYNITSFRSNDQILSCYSGDDICDRVLYQNVCGQYVRAARELGKKQDTMGQYYRSEIRWTDACEVSRNSIQGSKDPVSVLFGTS